jgi:oligoribonuclease NrnB/cAMP/cGMP phosphodiesterase (DHH superfamily)
MKLTANNVILFTHNDLDGIGGRIVFKEAFGRQAEVHSCGYHNVDQKIQDRLQELTFSDVKPTIFIADLGITKETADLLDAYTGDKIWLDHHKTNVELASNYDWATIDVDTSGTLLLYNFLEEEGFAVYRLRDFAIRVDDYDRWVHDYEESKQLNRLYFILGEEMFEERCLGVLNPIKFSKSDNLLLRLEEKNIERYTSRVAKGMVVHSVKEMTIGIGFAERFQSEVANDLLHEFDLDAVALIDINGQKISMRSKAHFDVGSIAKELGGGGHKNAAGLEFDKVVDVRDCRVDMIAQLYANIRVAHNNAETRAIEAMFAQEGVLH